MPSLLLTFSTRVCRSLKWKASKVIGNGVRIGAATLAFAALVACGGGGTTSTGHSQIGIQISSSSLSFGNASLATTTAAQSITVTSTGVLDLSISSVAISGANAGDFVMASDTCAGVALLPSVSCTVTVNFTPTGIGSRAASLTIVDDAPGSPHTIGLSGMGVAPVINFSSPSLNFVGQLANTNSAATTETITNTGNAPLNISAVTVSGANPDDFSKAADTCTGTPVAITNGTCTVSVKFNPTTSGPRSALLQFSDDATGSPQLVGLSGTGIPGLAISPATLTFPGQNVGTTGPAQIVTLMNNSAGPFSITAVNLSGAFSLTNNCQNSVAATSSCQILVSPVPTAPGTYYGGVSVSSTGSDAPLSVTLVGTGNGPVSGVLTQRYDNGRTGQNTQEISLAPGNVAPGQFGKLFSLPVDGQLYAQPLYVRGVTIPNQGVHNVIYAATEHDSVFAFDADGQSPTPLWSVSFLNPSAGVTTVPSQDVKVNDISPEIGITSTPVIDSTTGTLYVEVKTKEAQVPSCTSGCTYNYFQRLHALDITTGAEKFGGPVVITATVTGTAYDNVNGVTTFNPLSELQRPGLLLVNGVIYLGFGSHGDVAPYHGWLLAYDASTLQQIASYCPSRNSDEVAIWQAGGGLSADAAGNIYIVTANGPYNINAMFGTEFGDSVMKMQIQSGQFQILDYFTPANETVLQGNDLDLGASPAMLLPDQPGPTPHLLVTGGKDGRVWILNRDNLGQFQTNDVGAVQVIPDGSDALFDGASYWNGNLYVSQIGDFVKSYQLLNGIAQTPTASSLQIAYPNAVPAISSNGTSNGVLWIVKANKTTTGIPAILYALDANDVTNEIYDSSRVASDQAGAGVKFVIPTVVNGKVYVGTAAEVDVYGLLQ